MTLRKVRVTKGGIEAASAFDFRFGRLIIITMATREKAQPPRINNRRALHDYEISHRIECGMKLVGTEVKSLRDGKAQLHEAYAKIESGVLWLRNCHIDPYTKSAIVYNHDPRRDRPLLIHKRELKKLLAQTEIKGTTLIPLAIYFKDGRAKLELGVANGKQQYDKRATIKKKEQDRELRRQTMTHRS